MALNYSIKVFKLQNPTSALVGFASVCFEDLIEVKDFKVFDGRNGLFVKSPSRPGKDKEGNEKYMDTIWFNEQKEEGQFMGPFQKELFDQIIAEYSSQSGSPRVEAARRQQENNAPQAPANKVTKRPGW